MIAVWSFWSKPCAAFPSSPWKSEKYHLLSWILSLETAQKHYPRTRLVTDDAGARMLVDGIGLQFDHVSTELNALRELDPVWWALGKIHAYRSQKEPFVHIDSDVFLWNPLPSEVESSPVFAQNPEHFSPGDSWYHPEKFDAIGQARGWVPDEIRWFRSPDRYQRAECCGIFGGCNVEFINYYADRAIRLVEHPTNREVWPTLGGDNILVEQYYLSACIEYHKNREDSPFRDIDIQYLFQSSNDAFNQQIARQVSFTHVIGGAKRNEALLKKLEARVKKDYPERYERCIKYVEANNIDS